MGAAQATPFPGDAFEDLRREAHRWLRMATEGGRRGPRQHHRHGPGHRHGPPRPPHHEHPFDLGPGGPFGPGWPFGHWGRGFGGRRRGKRGDVRAAALVLLAEEPRNGYQIIQEIKARSDNMWRPSSGSVYPALQQLEDEGLIQPVQQEGGRRAFELTTAGREYVEEHGDELGEPWAAFTEDVREDTQDVGRALRQTFMAVMQVLAAGNERQVTEARKVLDETRRSMYRILAEDDVTSDAATDEEPDER
ncbi:hypothetical protein GCM10012275_31530 [Longimycelium tulufanense]|uniref:Transcription regulator PadR N-terminal domain-containing protein n=1 Tax=Longimycelium tulufanense TaxID=907463 RepID=A0A8J3CFI8_9PSEU|nr:PadR family transcriptional regulator [Longimycelium tulufanense]GGM58022.1 hypothetical protein GCM10012275_31530 [Longimycelium tulufanense]